MHHFWMKQAKGEETRHAKCHKQCSYKETIGDADHDMSLGAEGP